MKESYRKGLASSPGPLGNAKEAVVGPYRVAKTRNANLDYGEVLLAKELLYTEMFSHEVPRTISKAEWLLMAINIGIVDLAESRECKLTIRPASRVGHNLMYLKSIELTPLH